MQRSPTLSLRVCGPLAIFTRPELKTERVSYPVMTPSAARGLIEAILWKPAISWHIERIKVLNPIHFTAFRRNELNKKTSAPSAKIVANGGELSPYFAEDDRAQRNTIALRDVDYVIEAYFTLTDRAGPEDNVNKFVEMFKRRVDKGQHFHQPYFGCRECVADVMPVDDDTPPPIADTQDLGIMLCDIEFGTKQNTPRFFVAHLRQGVLEVPENPESTLTALVAGGAS